MPRLGIPNLSRTPGFEGVNISINQSISIITLAMNILGGWDQFNLKGDTLRRASSSSSFLYNIKELKYKQNKMGHQISKKLDFQISIFLRSDIPF